MVQFSGVVSRDCMQGLGSLGGESWFVNIYNTYMFPFPLYIISHGSPSVMLMCGAVGTGISSPRPGDEQSNGWREESGWSAHEGGAGRLGNE